MLESSRGKRVGDDLRNKPFQAECRGHDIAMLVAVIGHYQDTIVGNESMGGHLALTAGARGEWQRSG
ncbi:MAG TPA: hypothetical protein DCS31_09295 [Candidatus Competibacteraceae bacterium]|nr:hypothetical protein [Candidatus Competibacteraceae bacterium]